MKEYEFVEVHVQVGLAALNFTDYRRVVRNYAEKGYRFVGYVPTQVSSGPYGSIQKMDLVFEKDV